MDLSMSNMRMFGELRNSNNWMHGNETCDYGSAEGERYHNSISVWSAQQNGQYIGWHGLVYVR